MKKIWDDAAWEDYLYWQTQDKKTLRRINQLIRDAERDPFRGLGKPEPLKENLQGWWSRRINETDRLVYRVRDGALEMTIPAHLALRYEFRYRTWGELAGRTWGELAAYTWGQVLEGEMKKAPAQGGG